jgi:hypothetical protein
VAVLIAISAGLVASRIPLSSEVLRRRVIETLAERLDAEVELRALTLRFSPQLRAVATGLRIRHRGRTDVPPLISVQQFTVEATLAGLWNRRVQHVALEGLEIQIPPGDSRQDRRDGQQGRKARPTASAEEAGRERSEEPDYIRQVVIETLEAPDAQLVILRRDPKKAPRVWSMHRLRLQSVGLNSSMPFETVLTNAVPPGEITATGSFGPWARLDPGRTPLAGRFTFERADLGVFEGISGTLSAHGTFGGSLELIDVRGETSTPDFMVTISGHKVPLTTTYHAIVDGTNGNTTLDPVKATILDTSLVAQGGVYDVEGVKGRVVRLDVEIDGGRLEDIMRLAVNTAKPPMTGRLHLKTQFELPPGKRDVVEKLRLAGRFGIEGGRFTDAGVQEKVNELSRRARGEPAGAGETPRVASNFSGEFRLANSQLALPVVAFDVPGAVVELSGTYDLRPEQIRFEGNLFMDAKLSETMTGFKSLLLKIVDPLFRREGRTVVPLRIGGSRSRPEFGLDVKRALRRGAVDPPRTGPTGRMPSTRPPAPQPRRPSSPVAR